MKASSFVLTVGLGMAAGGAAMLMLPPQSKARRGAQKAVDMAEQKMAQMMS